MIADTKSQVVLSDVRDALARGDVEAAVRAVEIPTDYYAPLQREISRDLVEGGEYASESYPSRPYPGSSRKLIVKFDGREPRAERWVAARSSGLVTNITDDQRQAVRLAIRAGVEDGRGPADIALDLVGRVKDGSRRGGIVGLTEQQTQWVVSRRRKLEAEGRKPDQVQRMVKKYQNKLLLLRGTTIARTETIAAFNAGRVESAMQLVDSGRIQSADQIRLRWSATMDSSTRNIHVAMNGTTIGLYDYFVSPSTGARMKHPADSSLGAHGQDTINCRCYLEILIDWLAQARAA